MRNIRIAVVLFFAAAAMTSFAYSETFTVTTNADAGLGSLREAITFANSNGEADEIVFAEDFTITVKSPLPRITSMIAITGNGWSRSVIIGADSIDEGRGERVFSVAPKGKLILDSVMLKNENPTSEVRSVANEGAFIFLNKRAERKLHSYSGPGALYFDRELQYVDESDGSATIGVTRWDGSEGAVSVSYQSSDGTAVEGVDYVEASGVLSWADGDEDTKEFDVDIIDNFFTNEDKTVNLTLSDPTGGVAIPSPNALLVITDNEAGTGPCVEDLVGGVVCLREGRFEFTGTWTDFSDPAVTQPLIWTPVEDINATAGFQNNPTGIQIVMRVADACNFPASTWWIWLGGFTDAGWDITVRDVQTGIQRTYIRQPQAGSFPTTMRDSEFFLCD